MIGRHLWIHLVIGLFFVLRAAQGQAPAEIEGEASAIVGDDTFFGSVSVNVIGVEVYVTDKKGNPITGLKKEDFQILEDKRPVEITNFLAFASGAPVEEEPVDQTQGDDSMPAIRQPRPSALADQRLNLVVYVDNFNIRPFNRNRVFRRLREFLNAELGREDRIMLVSYDRSLHIRHPFTSDSRSINSALTELERFSGHAVQKDGERLRLLEEIGETEEFYDVGYKVRQYATEGHSDMRFTLSAMTDMVNSLAGMPGRKALLYVSDGIPMRPGEDLFYALQHKYGESSSLSQIHEFDLSREFRVLASQANSNRVAFYTIDAAGLRAPTSVSMGRMSPTAPGLDTYVDSIYFGNLQGTLRYLADRTGGLAIINTNDVSSGLSRMAADFDNYYSLGYSPAHNGDGRFHKIEVKLARKDLKIRHREGYRDKPMSIRMSDATMSQLRYGFEENPLDVDLHFGVGSVHEKDRFVVPILIDIPLNRVVLVPRSDFHEGKVKLYVAAMDSDGGIADVQEIDVPIHIPVAQVEDALAQNFRYQTQLLMRGGGHRVAVGVRDELGSESSFVSSGLMVGGG
jgi:VWFA-related protein